MKIHGTAKGGALSKKDFGVAFSSGGGGDGGCSNFEDSLGTDANGSNSGSTINTSDQKLGDGCLSFDGSNDFVNIDGAVDFSTTVGSISVWVNAGSSQDNTIMAFGDTDANEYLAIRSDGDSIFVLMRAAAGTQWESSKSGLGTDEWHLVTIVQDGTAVKWYFDNTEVTAFHSEADKSAWMSSGLDNGRLGCISRNSGGDVDFFDGLIDDIGLWDVAINSTTRDYIYNSGDGRKISQLGTAGTDTTCEGIKAYYDCDEFDDTSVLTNNAVPIE